MTSPLRFVLRQTADDASFQHMALCSPTQEFMHWFFPGAAQRLLGGVPYYLLCEVPALSPMPKHEVDTGECTMLGEQQEDPAEALNISIQNGLVQVHLQGHELQGDFTLARLSPESHIWRLSADYPTA
jgi:hypothetical protein